MNQDAQDRGRARRGMLRWTQVLSLGGLVLLLSAFGCGAGGGTDNGGSNNPPPTANVPTFDRTRAFGFLQSQVDFGPRAPGSTGHEACRQWLAAQLRAVSADVTEQSFGYTAPSGDAYTFTNLLAVFGAPAGRQLTDALLLGAHWDTRPVADQDPDPDKRDQPVLGANDGASGVAVLLELAQAFAAQAPSRPIIIAFFDFEDSGQLPLTAGQPYSGFSIGARYFSENMGRHRPREAVVVDMVGDQHQSLPQERNSIASNPALVNTIWQTANALGFGSFENRAGLTITDDHLPLIAMGVPSIDIIDLDYPGPNSNHLWHTTQDIPANCSPDSLRAVGQTLLQVIYGGS